jgi:hypothetical protein
MPSVPTIADSDTIKLKFGLAYDQTPVPMPSHRLVSLPDNNRTWFSTGAQIKVNKDSNVDVGVAYLNVPESHINNTRLPVATGEGPTTPACGSSAPSTRWPSEPSTPPGASRCRALSVHAPVRPDTLPDAKTRILDAAERLFMENGYAATSVRMITGAAGVPVALVSYHFGSKQGLMEAVYERALGSRGGSRVSYLDRARSGRQTASRLPLMCWWMPSCRRPCA